MSRDHRKLRAFELADALVLAVYQETREFPQEERFGLTAQLRRASSSVAGNIVEGCARHTEADLLRFLDIALGSLREVGYFIDLSYRLRFLDEEPFDRLNTLQDEAARTLSGLISSLRKPE